MRVSQLIMATIILSQFIVQSSFSSESIQRKLFTLEKSMNSENILLIHAQTDNSCKFVTNQNGYVDFYWLMNGTAKKEVHSMIRSTVAERVAFLGISKDRTSFTLKLNDLSELHTDLEDNKIEVRSQIINGNCEIKSIIKLGGSARYRKLNLKSTYCEVEKNFVGVPDGCKFVELRGKDLDTNENLTVRFRSK